MKNTLLSVACLAVFATVPMVQVQAQDSPAPDAAKVDPGSSSAITSKAWAALTSKNYDEAIADTGKCIAQFKPQALAMQKALTAPTTEKEETFKQWALNDVGTCYFIQGKAQEESGKQKEATESYKFLADNLPFAQCWDTKGWFWKPADAAKERIKALEFDSLK